MIEVSLRTNNIGRSNERNWTDVHEYGSAFLGSGSSKTDKMHLAYVKSEHLGHNWDAKPGDANEIRADVFVACAPNSSKDVLGFMPGFTPATINNVTCKSCLNLPRFRGIAMDVKRQS
jgi:hypothetical protein